MPYEVAEVSGIPKDQLDATIRRFQKDPRYLAHLPVDEPAGTVFLVVVMKPRGSGGTRSLAAAAAPKSRKPAAKAKSTASAGSARRVPK